MSEWLSSPFFGISLSIAAYAIGVLIQSKLNTPFANPLLIAIMLVIAFLNIFSISYEDFNMGGQIITMLLIPATVVLSISVYNQLDILKKNWLPVIVGCLAGSIASIISVWLLCRVFGLDDKMTISILPKSVTTPIAVGLSEQYGGIASVTVTSVIITGIFGTVFSPQLIRLFNVKNAVAAGVAIGTCSHVGGTTRAIELGETQGAMSSISIGITGLISTFIMMFIKFL